MKRLIALAVLLLVAGCAPAPPPIISVQQPGLHQSPYAGEMQR